MKRARSESGEDLNETQHSFKDIASCVAKAIFTCYFSIKRCAVNASKQD